MDKYICLDIGGTAIKYGLADSRGRLFNKDSLPNVIAKDGVDTFLDQVLGLIVSYQKYFKIQGAAISMAGMINPQTGEVLHAAPHFPGLTGTNLVQLVSRKLQLPCRVENDVNSAALGEYWLGNGRGAKSLFCITIGTGIGGAFVLDGKLWPGNSFTAGEVGQAKLGGRNHWEDAASVTALVQKAARLKGVDPETLNGKILCEMVRHGDKPLHRLLRETVHQWATGIAAICYMMNPQRVILGGGIMAQQDLLEPMLQDSLKKELLPVVLDKTTVAFAGLGNDAGLIGALYNFLAREKKRS
ncbi:ROK family protein [uncultured Acidaminococcus sp.]|uniref:ROK family protein n=1 Tax=uncultured Acidaminococcus sp. TaxID=352152 RepID=UPI00294324AA|nr:ROK family protein [uncultured Acidaminococcus sp.]